MKGKAVIPLVLGLCIGLVAVKFGVDAIKKAQGASTERETIAIVVAREDIDAFTLITPELLEIVETTDASLVPMVDRITAMEDVTNRVTAKAIPKSVPVMASMLAPVGTVPGMVGRIPTGFRAVSVKIDEVTGVAYQLKPGSWVDVTVVMEVDSGSSARRNKKETIAEVILQRIKVAAIGLASTGGGSEDKGTRVKPAKSVTLLVQDTDVPKLHLAATKGKITLSLRGEDDPISVAPPIASSRQDLGGGAPPEPVTVVATALPVEPPPELVEEYPPHTLLIYHGGMGSGIAKVDHIIFENAGSRLILKQGDGPTLPSASGLFKQHDRSRSSMPEQREEKERGTKPATEDEADEADTEVE